MKYFIGRVKSSESFLRYLVKTPGIICFNIMSSLATVKAIQNQEQSPLGGSMFFNIPSADGYVFRSVISNIFEEITCLSARQVIGGNLLVDYNGVATLFLPTGHQLDALFSNKYKGMSFACHICASKSTVIQLHGSEGVKLYKETPRKTWTGSLALSFCRLGEDDWRACA